MLKMNHNSSVILSENELSDLINWAEEVNLNSDNLLKDKILKSLFDNEHLKLTFKISACFSFVTTAYYSILIFLPYIFQNYGNSHEFNKEFIYIFSGLFEILGITISCILCGFKNIQKITLILITFILYLIFLAGFIIGNFLKKKSINYFLN